MRRLCRRLWRDQCGQDVVEYALLVVMLGLASVAAVRSLADAISNGMHDASAMLGGGSQQGAGAGGNGQGNGNGTGYGNSNGGGKGQGAGNGNGNGGQKGGGGGNGP